MRPEFKEAVKIAATGEYKCIPVSLELYADQYTPLVVLRKLKNVSRHCYMLESAEDNQKWGRYTFLGYDPRLEITCTNGKLTIKNGTSVNMETNHPGEYIRQILDENKSPKIEGFPTFTGGLVGYFSYDYMKYAEPSMRWIPFCRLEPYREHRRSGPARSSMSWKIISGASTEEPLVIWISPETWIPVLRFVLHIRKMARYLSEAVQASWLTACHRKNIRSVSTRQRQ